MDRWLRLLLAVAFIAAAFFEVIAGRSGGRDLSPAVHESRGPERSDGPFPALGVLR